MRSSRYGGAPWSVARHNRPRLAELLVLEKKQLELSKLESDFLANHDLMTGLMNRRAFEQRLRQMMETDTQQRAATAVMYIDLDNFKVVERHARA